MLAEWGAGERFPASPIGPPFVATVTESPVEPSPDARVQRLLISPLCAGSSRRRREESAALSDRDKPTFREPNRRKRERNGRGSGNGRSGGNGRGGGNSRGGGNGGRPRGEKAQRRARSASAACRRKVEERLFGKKGDRTRLRLEERLRAAHGTPNFHRTYREYVKVVGMPEDVGLLGLLLDLEEEREVLKVVEGIEGVVEGMSHEQRSLVRSRLRNLEMSTPSDAVADAAADLLENL